jgi:manganese oxidase
VKQPVYRETLGMKNFSRGFFLSAIAAGALIAAGVRFAAADGQSGQSPAPAPSPVIVVIKDFAFSPDTLTVSVGSSVTWRNNDSVAHTVTANGKSFDSGNLAGGKTFTYAFTKPGTYDYVCSYHPSMTATVVVSAPASPSP